ncbi:hypothetical protein BJX63DRAFT_63825 [Aspergillus granulosus]|uniref:Zn(2)-C6 fungal-type domain-containing protein n=1 Tax=Aspergillus granulosus TaxID=176169 RepID=A0ABR4GXH6_9EURO
MATSAAPFLADNTGEEDPTPDSNLYAHDEGEFSITPSHNVSQDLSAGDAAPNAKVEAPLPIQKRRRVTRCDECRRKKVKCDQKQPCTHCTVYRYECTYNQPSNRRRNPAPQYVEALDNLDDPQIDVHATEQLPQAIKQEKASQQPLSQPPPQPSDTNGPAGAPGPDGAGADESLLESMVDNTGSLDLDDQGHWDYHGHTSGIISPLRLRKQLGVHQQPGTAEIPIRTRPDLQQILESPKSMSESLQEPSLPPMHGLPPRDVARLYSLPFSSEHSPYSPLGAGIPTPAAPGPVASDSYLVPSRLAPVNPSIYNLSHAESIFTFDNSWGTPATSVCEEDFVSQISQDIHNKVNSLERDELHRLRNVLQRGLALVDSLLPPLQRTSTDGPMWGNTNRYKYRCAICKTGMIYPSRGTLKRHFTSIHFSEVMYRCPIKGCSLETPRRDKFYEHHRRNHHAPQPNIEEAAIHKPPPRNCPICECPIGSWEELWKCIFRNSEIPSEPPTQSRGMGGNGLYTRSATSQHFVPRAQVTAPPTTSGSHQEQLRREEAESLVLLSELEYVEPRVASADSASSNPSLFQQYMHTSKDQRNTLSPNSSSKSGPADTSITTPECLEGESIDSAIPPADCLDFILDPVAHEKSLQTLEIETARLCGLHEPYLWSDSSMSTIPMKECLDLLKGCLAAFCNLRNEGFCGRTLTVFLENPSRPSTAEAIHITLDDIETLVMQPSTRMGQELDDLSLGIIQQLTGIFPPTASLGSEQIETSSYLSFIYRVLSLSIVSFSGSHVCPFDVSSWDRELASIPVGLGYSFARRRLACMSEFVGGPVWTLGEVARTQDDPGLMLSMNIQDLQQLWGPIWMVGGTEEAAPIIRTERGYLTPLLVSDHISYLPTEIVCHWAKDLPEPYLPGQPVQNRVMIDKSSQLLIGVDEGKKNWEIIINERCKADINVIQQQIISELRFPGTCKAYYVGEGYEVSLSGGYQVNAGIIKRWKRMPARTHRSMLLAYCMSPGAEILPILKLEVGLEVSMCTGNSRRVSLWEAIQLSQVKQRGVESEYTQVFCGHTAGSIECICKCWNWADREEIDQILDAPGDHEEFKQASARRKLINAILALEHTGINHRGQLQALWPFSKCPQVRHIPSNTKRQKHNWLGLVKDTYSTSATFLRPSGCFKQSIAQPVPTVLCTRVFKSPDAVTNGYGFEQGVHLRFGEESLEVMDRQLGDPMAVIVKKSRVPSWFPQGMKIKEHINPSNRIGYSCVMLAC